MERLFLDVRKPLVFAVADWLAAQSRVTPGGVVSLAHLMVIVPTRQAGRRLRLALAERIASGCVPPVIRMPLQAVAPACAPALPVATAAESLGLLCRTLLDVDLARFPQLFPAKGRPTLKTFAWALGVARQLYDLWGLLEENALCMGDVAGRVEALLSGEDLDVEISRWQDLAKLEQLFFDALASAGRTPEPLARKQAVAEPLLPAGVERIVLPALTDAMPALYAALEGLSGRAALTVLLHAEPAWEGRFDAWGRPEPEPWTGRAAPCLPLRDEQITLAADSAEQARLVASLFAGVKPDEELPALGMAEDALFPELQSAFLNTGRILHHPARSPLVSSPLGRLIRQLERLCRDPRWPVLSAFLREADVLRWLEARPSAPAADRASFLSALDELQNAHLPQTFADARRFCGLERERARNAADAARWEQLSGAFEALAALLDPKGRPHLAHLSELLQELFASRLLLRERPGDRELAAAASAALAAFEAMASPLLEEALDDGQRALLFDALLSAAHYQLEPEDTGVLLTDGWLELPWSPAREVVITGFNEGAVPDAVVGHAFLPDRLRQGLGLMNNERRAARDTYLLYALLASRPQGSVQLFLERVSSENDARKPSRLLFLCDDATLVTRAKKLFGSSEPSPARPLRSLPDAWRLALPPPEPPPRVSVTGLSDYLECPFTFYLKHILRLETRDDRMAELDPAAFGDLCHTVLDRFGKSEFKDSSDADTIQAVLEAALWQLARERYGERLPAIIHLQVSAAGKRLAFFAARQAQLQREGWRIVETEHALEMQVGGMRIRGRVDRIDRHRETGAWRILDYKTWDILGKKGGSGRFLSSARADLEAAAGLGLEPFVFEGKPHVWTDLQLPLYRLMLRANGRATGAEPVHGGYFVLGETEAETLCATWDFAPFEEPALACVRRVLERVKAGLFWPPSRRRAWATDFGSLFLETPEASVDAAWIRDQEARLAKGGCPCVS